MQVVKIRFRVPGGEEFSDERMESLAALEIDEENVSSEEDGEILVRMRLAEPLDEAELEDLIEEFAESVLDANGDMDFLDFDYIDEA